MGISLKDKQSTYKSIVNGWLHTGDLGLIDDEKYIKILGRKNEMIVNSGGKNIAPEPLEDLFLTYDEKDICIHLVFLLTNLY